jgi:hypothetical protein
MAVMAHPGLSGRRQRSRSMGTELHFRIGRRQSQRSARLVQGLRLRLPGRHHMGSDQVNGEKGETPGDVAAAHFCKHLRQTGTL